MALIILLVVDDRRRAIRGDAAERRVTELNAVPRLVARLRGTADAETHRCILGVDLLDGQPMRRPRRS
jgi:hypothetical protein